MGKGDRRTRRGKIYRGTTGKRRPKAKGGASAVMVKVEKEQGRTAVKRTKPPKE